MRFFATVSGGEKMRQQMIWKMFYRVFCLLGIVFLTACTTGEKATEEPLEILNMSIGISTEPDSTAVVDKIILELNHSVPYSKVNLDTTRVLTNGIAHKKICFFGVNEDGMFLSANSTESRYLAILLDPEDNQERQLSATSPWELDPKTGHHRWVSSYPVSVQQLKIDGKSYSIEGDTIQYRKIPLIRNYTVQKNFEGEYLNPLTGKMDSLSLHYAASQPDSYLLKDNEKIPLLVWLPNQRGSGNDMDIAILTNEVWKLMEYDIQQEFLTNHQGGLATLVVQPATSWLDEGDASRGFGSGVSGYTKILMDTIQSYITENPHIDPKRIYLAGDAEGGYMTVNMAIHYPDSFAAIVPISPYYPYYEQERNPDGSYKILTHQETNFETTISTETVWFTQEKANRIKHLPIWFIHADNNTTIYPQESSMPIYKALLNAGAKNAWYSYYESVRDFNEERHSYPGEDAWMYVVENRVKRVQDVEQLKQQSLNGGFVYDFQYLGGTKKAEMGERLFSNLFEWLNAQVKE